MIALGKLGGQELNYSSDIDLMFLYGGNGETDGPAAISNKEFYKKVANEYTALLSTYTSDGQCYRVDLRLRPDGTWRNLHLRRGRANLLRGARARLGEADVIKARVSAGEPGPGVELLESVEPLIYQTWLDFRAVEAVSETRQRISEKMAARRGGQKRLDIKLMPGGIRDIEFLVQCLQRLHGGREQWVRHAGTMLAMFRLRDKGLLRRVNTRVSPRRPVSAVPGASPADGRGSANAYSSEGSGGVGIAGAQDADTGHGPGFDDAAGGASHRGAGHLHRVVHAQKPLYYTIASEVEAPLEESDSAQLDEAAAAANLHRGRERLEHFLKGRLPMIFCRG